MGFVVKSEARGVVGYSPPYDIATKRKYQFRLKEF